MPTGLLPVWLGLRSGVGNEFTSVPPPLPDGSGPTHNTGSASAARNLAVATLRISRGHQYRRLLLTDRSKPVSARRGLPTLTSPAHPETASGDRRDQEAGNYGRARDNLATPVVTPDAFIDLRGGGTLVLGSHERPSNFNSRYAERLHAPFLALLGPPGCTQAFPNLRPGLLNCRRGTGRVKITRESNLSQDQPSVPHSPGE